MDLKEKLKGRRRRIIILVATFFMLGMLMTSNPLEHWLGWSLSGLVWTGASGVVMVCLVWEVLGFFIDRSNTTKTE